MLSFFGKRNRPRDGMNRREALRIGGLGFPGLMWSDCLRARSAAASQGAPSGRQSAGTFGKAKSCILIFNSGAPSHLDTFDLKPDGPVEIRGEFKSIATNVAGTSIVEHLPHLPARADRYTILRSVNHPDNDHAVGAYLALTGYPHPPSRPLGTQPAATPQDMPSMGSAISKVRP